MEDKISLTFHKSFKKEILEIFDKKIDDEGLIVEKDSPTQRVLSPDGESIRLKEFAGITKGSEIFIKSDLISLIELAKRKKQ